MRGVLTLMACQFAGTACQDALHLPVPGPVIGMGLLLTILVMRPGGQGLAGTEAAAEELLRRLPLLLVPAGVGLVACGSDLATAGPALLVAVLASTVVAIAGTGMLMDTLLRWSDRVQDGVEPDRSDLDGSFKRAGE